MAAVRGIFDGILFIFKLILQLILFMLQAALEIVKIFFLLLSMVLRVFLAFIDGCTF